MMLTKNTDVDFAVCHRVNILLSLLTRLTTCIKRVGIPLQLVYKMESVFHLLFEPTAREEQQWKIILSTRLLFSLSINRFLWSREDAKSKSIVHSVNGMMDALY